MPPTAVVRSPPVSYVISRTRPHPNPEQVHSRLPTQGSTHGGPATRRRQGAVPRRQGAQRRHAARRPARPAARLLQPRRAQPAVGLGPRVQFPLRLRPARAVVPDLGRNTRSGRRSPRRPRHRAAPHRANRPCAGGRGAVAEDAPTAARPAGYRTAVARVAAVHGRVVGGVPGHCPRHRRPRRGRLVTAADRTGRPRPRARCRRPRRAGDPRSTRRRLLVEAIEDHHRSRHRRIHAEVQRVFLDHELARAQPRRGGHPAARSGRGRAVRRSRARSAAVLRQLADFVGEPTGDMDFLTSATATLEPTQTVGGTRWRR